MGVCLGVCVFFLRKQTGVLEMEEMHKPLILKVRDFRRESYERGRTWNSKQEEAGDASESKMNLPPTPFFRVFVFSSVVD